MPEDVIEKIKEMWAFHLPCVLLIHKSDYWKRLKPIYQEIYTDISLNVKTKKSFESERSSVPFS